MLVLLGVFQIVTVFWVLMTIGSVFDPEAGFWSGIKIAVEYVARGSSTVALYANFALSLSVGVLLIALGVIAVLRRPWSRPIVVGCLACLVALHIGVAIYLFQQHATEGMRRVQLDKLRTLVPLLIIFAVPRTWRPVTKNAGTVTDVTA